MPDDGRLPVAGSENVGDLYGPTFTVKFYADTTTLPEGSTAKTEPPPQVPIEGTPTEVAAKVAYEVNRLTQIADNTQLQLKLDKKRLDRYAAQLTIEASLGAPHVATLTLNPTYQDAIEILDNRLIRFFSVMEIQWGYYNNLRSPQYFRLIQPKFVVTPRETNITLQGLDLTASNLINSGTFTSFDRNNFKTDYEIIYELVENRLKKQLNLIDIPTSHPLYQPSDLPVNNFGNDWHMLKKICFDNWLTFTVDGNEVILHQMDKLAVKEAAYNLLVYKKPSKRNDIPVINFSSNILASAYYSPAVVSAMALKPDLDNQGNSLVMTIDSAQLEGTRAGNREDVDAAGAGTFKGTSINVGGGIMLIPKQFYDDKRSLMAGEKISLPPGVSEEKAKQIVREASLRANTTATVTTPGVPTVVPPMCVNLDGAGDSLNGSYFIQKARHEIGRGGYEMTLDLMRTLSSPLATSGEKPAEQPQRQAHPQPGVGTNLKQGSFYISPK